MKIDEIGHLQRMSLEPGDILVITSPDHLTRENVKRIEESFAMAAPGHKVIVLTAGMKLGAIRKAA